MADFITTEMQGHIMLIGLNRADKRNGMNRQMIDELAEAYGAFAVNDDARVAVVFAEGDHFCAGLELDEAAESIMSPTGGYKIAPASLDPWGVLTPRVEKPVILAVQGFCITLGLELCLAADIVIAADTVKFAQLEITRGLYPMGGATLRWPLACGYQNAMRYLLTGDWFGADEAHRTGLVQEVVSAEALKDHAIGIADRIAANAPMGVQATLRTARRAQDFGQRGAAETLYPEIRTIYVSEDAQTGIATYMNKERPIYKGR